MIKIKKNIDCFMNLETLFIIAFIVLIGFGYLLDAEHARNIQKISVVKNFEHDDHIFIIRENYFIHHPNCKCLNKDLQPGNQN
jgi:hypothetical protein